MANYNPEQYWDEVARQIRERKDGSVIAGDDEPYYRYKRKRFLELFLSLPFSGKTVLEIGSGPGGNLDVLTRMNCRSLTGADLSQEMVDTATRFLKGRGVSIVKTDGVHLPFNALSFDLVFTSTVLQHITDTGKLRQLVSEISRVSAGEILLFERIEKNIRGHESNLGRPVSYYKELLSPHGFRLKECRFLPLQASYYTCGLIRKIFNRPSRKEGEPVTGISALLEKAVLPFTRILDKIIPSRRDVAMMRFVRTPQ